MKYNLVAQLQLQGPSNSQANRVVNQINKQLQGVAVNIRLNANNRQITQVAQNIQGIGTQANKSTKQVNKLGQAFGTATRRFGAVALVTGFFLRLTRAITDSVGEAIKFEREIVRISQITGKTTGQLSGLVREVTRLSTGLGVASKDILETARVLSQAGFSANNVTRALDILSKTTLAPTFDTIQDTTEGAIALLNQFKNEARATGDEVKFLETSLGAINQVSKQFAVESSDLITVIRKTGGVFESSGGKLNELLALFTSVRSTTRESADTIATGFRTIFTRIQRVETLETLKRIGIELQDAEGKFVGPLQAIERLSSGLRGLDPRDFRFNQIVEQLGGFRQIGKVIPLITKFRVSTDALAAAQEGQNSISEDAVKAQESLEVQLAKVSEKFQALFRRVADSEGFRSIVSLSIKLAEALIRVGDALIPLIPILSTFVGLKVGSALAGFTKGVLGRNQGGPIPFARGGAVPGSGNRDTVPAMLTPGEFVIRKSSVNKIGMDTLTAMNDNRFNLGGGVNKKNVASASDDELTNFLGSSKFNSLDISKQKLIKNEIANRSQAKTAAKTTAELKSGIVGGLFLQEGNRASSKFTKSAAGRFSANGFSGIDTLSGNIYTGTLDEVASGNIREQTEKSIESAVKNAAANTMAALEIEPLNIDEKKAADNAIKKVDFTSIEGFVFEAFTSALSGAPLSDAGATFDYVNPSGQAKKRLANIFGPDPVTGRLLDAKRTLSTDSITGGANSIANKIIAAVNSGQLTRSDFVFRNRGGGISGEDTVPALLTPGEFVFNKKAAAKIGLSKLEQMNRQGIAGFNSGGAVGSVQRFATGGGVGVTTDTLVSDENREAIRLGAFTEEIEKATKTKKEETDQIQKSGRDREKARRSIIENQKAMSESSEKAFSAAQNFVFLAGTIGAIIPQLGGFGQDTANGISTAVAQFSALVGVLGIAGQAVSAFATSSALAGTKFGTAITASIGPLAILATAVIAVTSAISGLEAAANSAFDRLIEDQNKKISSGDFGGVDFTKLSINIANRSISDDAFSVKNFISSDFNDKIINEAVALGRNIQSSGESLKNSATILKEAEKAISEGGDINFSDINKTEKDLKNNLSKLNNVFLNADEETRKSIQPIIAAFEGQLSDISNLRSDQIGRLKSDVLKNQAIDLERPNKEARKQARQSLNSLEEAVGGFNTKEFRDFEAELEANKQSVIRVIAARQQELQAINRLTEALNAAANVDRLIAQTSRATDVALGGNDASQLTFSGLNNVGNFANFEQEIEDSLGFVRTSVGKGIRTLADETLDATKGISLLDNNFFVRIRDELSSFEGGDFRSVTKDLPDRIREQVNKIIEEGQTTGQAGEFADKLVNPEEQQKIRDRIAELNKDLSVLNEAVVKASNQFLDSFGQLTDGILDSRNNIRTIIEGGRSTELARAEQSAGFTGGRLSVQQRDSILNRRSQSVSQLQSGINTAISSRNAFATAAGSGTPQERAKASANAKEQARTTNILTEELKKLADQSARASDILADIDFEQSKVKAFTDALTDFTFTTNQGRQDIQRNFAALNTVLATGSIESIPDQFRPVVGQLLDQFKDVNLAGNLTGSDIKSELNAQTLERLLGRRLSTQERERIRTNSSSEVEQLRGLFGDLQKEERAAREALIKLEEDRGLELLKKRQELEENFFNRLSEEISRLTQQNQQGQQQIAGNVEVDLTGEVNILDQGVDRIAKRVVDLISPTIAGGSRLSLDVG